MGKTQLKITVEPRQLISKDTSGRNVTTSLIIAEATGKQHRHVLADIKKILDNDEIDEPNFRPTSYIDVQSKERPMYQVTKTGFTYLLAGYTGKNAKKLLRELSVEFDNREKMITELKTVITEKEEVYKKITLLIKDTIIEKIRSLSFYSKKTIKDIINESLDTTIKNYEKKHGEIKTP